MKRMKPMLALLFAMIVACIALVAGAFATEISAANVQAAQLQLHIDKAITVGGEVIADVNAQGKDSSNLTTTLNALVALRAQVDANSTTLDEVKQQRDEARELVKQFRDEARTLISEEKRAEVKAEAEAKAEREHKDREEMVKKLRSEFNSKRLDMYVEAQQRMALGLNASENISIVPELAQKMRDIRMKINEDKVSKDEFVAMRTEIKADVEALKANRSQTLAEIRAHQLERHSDVLALAINQTTDANVSAELTSVKTDIDALLASYAAGEVSDDEFNTQAHELLDASVKVMQGPAFAGVRGKIMASVNGQKIEIRSDIKDELKSRMERTRMDLKNESEHRLEIRANGTRVEQRERVKDGQLEVRSRMRSDNSGHGSESDDSDSNDDSDSDDDESVSVSATI